MSTSIYSIGKPSLSQIYRITNKVNGKFYIGYTSLRLSQRWAGHVYSARTQSQGTLHRAIRKYGHENFSIETIYYGDDKNHTLNVMEPYFIKELKPHYNCASGGNVGYTVKPDSERIRTKPSGGLGIKRPEKSKQMTGKGNPMANSHGLFFWNNGIITIRSRECPGPEWSRGVYRTKEALQRMSNSHIGNNNRAGIPHSSEAKAKISKKILEMWANRKQG